MRAVCLLTAELLPVIARVVVVNDRVREQDDLPVLVRGGHFIRPADHILARAELQPENEKLPPRRLHVLKIVLHPLRLLVVISAPMRCLSQLLRLEILVQKRRPVLARTPFAVIVIPRHHAVGHPAIIQHLHRPPRILPLRTRIAVRDIAQMKYPRDASLRPLFHNPLSLRHKSRRKTLRIKLRIRQHRESERPLLRQRRLTIHKHPVGIRPLRRLWRLWW